MDDTKTRIVIGYSLWATICAALAGIIVTLIHTFFYSYHPGRSALLETLFTGAVAAVGIAAGQGAVALVTGSVLARLGRALRYTVLLGLLIGLFDFVMYFLQIKLSGPGGSVGIRDLIVVVVVTVGITAAGARRAAAPM